MRLDQTRVANASTRIYDGMKRSGLSVVERYAVVRMLVSAIETGLEVRGDRELLIEAERTITEMIQDAMKDYPRRPK